MAFYNNILWWAKGNHETDEKSLRKAFEVLDNIILRDFSDEFIVTLPKNRILYRARDIYDLAYIENGELKT